MAHPQNRGEKVKNKKRGTAKRSTKIKEQKNGEFEKMTIHSCRFSECRSCGNWFMHPRG